jgi:hypothetical protein
MSIIVTTDKFHDPEDLLRAIHDLGIEAHRIGKGRSLHVDCDMPDEFPLKDDPRVWGVEDIRDDYVGLGAVERQVFTLPRNLSPNVGNWSIPRIIRRDRPWDFRNHPGPFDMFYEAGLDGSGVDIYISDTGCRVNHVEFGGRASIIYQAEATANGDVNGHGTGCASMAAGGISGIARGANILSFKTLENDNTGNTFKITTALQEMLDYYQSAPQVALNRPAVVNMSWGGGAISTSHRDIIGQMIAAGMIVVAAAGNNLRTIGLESNQLAFYPAMYANVIVAGGSNVLDEPYDTGDSFGTNFGPNISIVAGAQRVRIGYGSGNSDTQFVLANGTSFASPATVGVIACLMTGLPRPTAARSTNQRIRWHLRQMATQGRLRTVRGVVNSLPDRLLYLDPARTTPIDLNTVPVDPGYTPATPTTLSNPSFETGTPNTNAAIPGWAEENFGATGAYDYIQIINSTAQVGSQCVTFSRMNTLVNGESGYIENTTDVSLPIDKAAIAAGGTETISITYGARVSNLVDLPGRTRPVVYWYDENGDFCGDVFGTYITLPSDTAWADYSWGPWTIPPMARRFKIRIWAWANAAENNLNVLVDNVRFSYGSDT